MEIGLRQAYVLGFERKFPLTSGLLTRNVETTYAGLFSESGSKPEKYKFELSVGYYKEDEEDRLIGESVTAQDGTRFCETRTVSIIGRYRGSFGHTKIAHLGLNLVDAESGFPLEETKDIEALFTQIKSYPLDLVPKEIEA